MNTYKCDRCDDWHCLDCEPGVETGIGVFCPDCATGEQEDEADEQRDRLVRSVIDGFAVVQPHISTTKNGQPVHVDGHTRSPRG